MRKIRPSENYEIFISYAHKDNLPPPPHSEHGWVTHFDKLLEYFLIQWRGEPTIWRDDEMRRSEVIVDTILQPLPRAGVLITVVSPNYFTSEWCARELDAFCSAAEETLGVQVHNRMRVFKIVKAPLQKAQQTSDDSVKGKGLPQDFLKAKGLREAFLKAKGFPDVFVKATGFDFYDVKEKNRKPVFFGPDESTEDAKQLFRDRVGDVAWEVIEVLNILSECAEDEKPQPQLKVDQDPQPLAVSVYLADVTPDLTNQRDNVSRDLLHRGYNIVQLSIEDSQLETKELKDKISRDLKDCGFSIHLIGNEFGDCPPGTTTSIVEIQVEAAAERAKGDERFQRLIWIPDGAKPQHTSQRRFVNALLDSNFARNTELLRRSLENFKTVIQDKIHSPLAAPTEVAKASSVGVRTVGIICDKLDSERVGRLDDCLFEQGCDVIVSLGDGAAAGFTDEDFNRLAICDSIIIYMDSAPLFWVQARLLDANRIEEHRQKKFRSVAVYVGGRKSEEKERFRTRKAVVIKNFEDSPDALLGPIPPHLLQPFLDKLDEKERGQVS